MVPGHDVAVEAEADHQAGTDARRPGRRRPGPAGRGDRAGQRCRVAAQAEMLGDQVLGPAGRTVNGTLGRSLSKAETVPSPPTATRQRQRGSAADRLTSADRSSGVQAISRAETDASQCARRAARPERKPRPMPELRLATIPTQSASPPSALARRRPAAGRVGSAAEDRDRFALLAVSVCASRRLRHPVLGRESYRASRGSRCRLSGIVAQRREPVHELAAVSHEALGLPAFASARAAFFVSC